MDALVAASSKIECKVENRWNDDEAKQFVEKFQSDGEDMALRVYTSQLIGKDPQLVLHGGGNTSVKITRTNQVGEEVKCLAVKGSGWDLSNILPPGLPCVRLEHCCKLSSLSSLTDEDMVNELRTQLLNFKSPTPSVETLLHAFLPHKFVDHSHADAILAIVDQPNAEQLCRQIWGTSFGIVEYIMPGFTLAKRAKEVYEADPSVKGLLLLKHGLFTFGESAKQSYDRHITAVQAAQTFITNNRQKSNASSSVEVKRWVADTVSRQNLGALLPVVRGVFSELSGGQSWVVTYRPGYQWFADSKELVRSWSQRGPLTPDHVIRTKGVPCLVPAAAAAAANTAITAAAAGQAEAAAAALAEIQESLREEIQEYMQQYHAYFTRQQARSGRQEIQELDSLPRVLLVEGVGLLCVDRSLKAAQVSADIYEHTVNTIEWAESIGRYQPNNEADRFDMEYWDLEQAKLKVNSTAAAAASADMKGKVALITGAGSGIGLETSRYFAAKGAHVVLVDKEVIPSETVASVGPHRSVAVAVQCDVTCASQVQEAFTSACLAFGGVDVVVSNAGAAVQGPVLDCQQMKKSMDLNFWSHQYVSVAAVKVFQAQRSKGCVLYNASKAALNPGPNFGAYAVAKSAVLTLMKCFAQEFGHLGVRFNAVNADRVRTALFTQKFVQDRAKARKVTPEEYFKCNLLHDEVLVADVAQAFFHLAVSYRTTAAVVTVDGGNIAASVR